MNEQKHPNPHVLRYDQHMPEIDDLSLIVLKGHLLVEEMLHQVKDSLFPHAECLKNARLSFAQLTAVVRAACNEHDQLGWKLILSLNCLRNDLSHSLEHPKLKQHLQNVIDLYFRAHIREELDYGADRTLDDKEQMRNVISDCMCFLRGIWWRRQE